MTQDDQNFYYTAKEGIVKVDKKTNTAFLLYPREGVSLVNYNKGKLYFNDSSNDRLIKSIDISGKGEKVVWNMDDHKNLKQISKVYGIAEFQIYNDEFYIWTNGITVIRYNPVTNKTEAFLDDVGILKFSENYAYYIDHAQRTFSIYRKNLKTGETILLRGDGKTKERYEEPSVPLYDNLVFVGNQLYYTTRLPYTLRKYDENGPDPILARTQDRFFGSLEPSKDALYYVTATEKENISLLWKLDVASGNSMQIKQLVGFSPFDDMKIVDGRIFYYSSTEDKVMTFPLP